MFGINPGEFAVLLVIALIVVGPERLPTYAAQLGRMVREGRKMAMGLREQVRGELGPEFDDVDWKKLDPRQYDPRKIIRDALTDTFEDDEPPARPAAKPVSSGGPAAAGGAAAAGATAAARTNGSAKPAGAGLPSVSPAAKRPESASPATGAGAPGGAGTDGASKDRASEDGAVQDGAAGDGAAGEGADAVGVPLARSSAGAAVDLEAT